MDTTTLLDDCKRVLTAHYADRFCGLFLYGSMARNNADNSSDIDVLVLLSGPFDYFKELRKIIDLLYPIQLKSDRLISAKPAVEDEFNAGGMHFYRTIKHEGMAA